MGHTEWKLKQTEREGLMTSSSSMHLGTEAQVGLEMWVKDKIE